MGTQGLMRGAVEAAREDRTEILDALLEAGERHEASQRWTIRLVGGLLAVSVVANIALVALVLSGTLSVSGFGVEVGVGAGEAPAEGGP